MNLGDYPEVAATAAKLTPGAVGALVSLRWVDGAWTMKVFMAVAGVALSYYASSDVARYFGTAPGLTGFLLGLFGMAAVAKLFASWDRFDATTLLRDFARKVLGLPPKES